MKTILMILISTFLFMSGAEVEEFELKKEIENSTHIQVTKVISVTKVRGNLGVMELNDRDSLVFKSKYGNAIILKSDIQNYVEVEDETIN